MRQRIGLNLGQPVLAPLRIMIVMAGVQLRIWQNGVCIIQVLFCAELANVAGDFFTFDAMSQVVFGTSYHLLSSADNHWIIDCVLGQLRRISFLNQLRQLENMKLDKVLFPDARRKAFRFTGMSRQIMETRKDKMGTDAKNDLFGKLLAAKDPETGKALSHRQLWAESNTLIIAGEQPACTCKWGWNCKTDGRYRVRYLVHRHGSHLLLPEPKPLCL